MIRIRAHALLKSTKKYHNSNLLGRKWNRMPLNLCCIHHYFSLIKLYFLSLESKKKLYIFFFIVRSTQPAELTESETEYVVQVNLVRCPNVINWTIINKISDITIVLNCSSSSINCIFEQSFMEDSNPWTDYVSFNLQSIFPQII